VRTWRTASTTSPVPASPFVRINAAPSYYKSGIKGCGMYGYTTKCFAEVATATNEGDFIAMFGDVVDFISWSQHFTFVNIINPNRLKDLQYVNTIWEAEGT
jgi:hypothetical protein